MLDIILAILATYRISRMIVGEDGPFNLFNNLRGHIMKRYDNNHWLYSGINCPLCVSFWIAAILSLYTAPSFLFFFLHWWGIAGAVTLIYRRIE